MVGAPGGLTKSGKPKPIGLNKMVPGITPPKPKSPEEIKKEEEEAKKKEIKAKEVAKKEELKAKEKMKENLKKAKEAKAKVAAK